MFGIALVCSGLLLSATPDEAGRTAQTAADLQTTRPAEPKLAATPTPTFGLALWCEEHGLDAERAKGTSPWPCSSTRSNAIAHVDGAWSRGPGQDGEKPAERAAERVHDDPKAWPTRVKNAPTDGARTAKSADAHWKLALWCEGHGLGRGHRPVWRRSSASTRTAIAAWKQLGYRESRRRWATDAKIAEAKANAEAKRKADRHWKPH